MTRLSRCPAAAGTLPNWPHPPGCWRSRSPACPRPAAPVSRPPRFFFGGRTRRQHPLPCLQRDAATSASLAATGPRSPTPPPRPFRLIVRSGTRQPPPPRPRRDHGLHHLRPRQDNGLRHRLLVRASTILVRSGTTASANARDVATSASPAAGPQPPPPPPRPRLCQPRPQRDHGLCHRLLVRGATTAYAVLIRGGTRPPPPNPRRGRRTRTRRTSSLAEGRCLLPHDHGGMRPLRARSWWNATAFTSLPAAGRGCPHDCLRRYAATSVSTAATGRVSSAVGRRPLHPSSATGRNLRVVVRGGMRRPSPTAA